MKAPEGPRASPEDRGRGGLVFLAGQDGVPRCWKNGRPRGFPAAGAIQRGRGRLAGSVFSGSAPLTGHSLFCIVTTSGRVNVFFSCPELGRRRAFLWSTGPTSFSTMIRRREINHEIASRLLDSVSDDCGRLSSRPDRVVDGPCAGDPDKGGPAHRREAPGLPGGQRNGGPGGGAHQGAGGR